MLNSVSSSPTHSDSGYAESSTRQSSTSSLDSSNHASVPSSHPARTLVLCFDGTGDQFDADNSNVVAFFSLLKKDDRNEQMVYYQPGIGTYTSNTQNPTGLKARVDKLLDKMVAWNLGDHVMGGYEFLMQNYQAGDKISLFGFSRGAYTARALAGMIYKVGLLPACNHQQVPFAYSMYLRKDDAGFEDSKKFKKAFSIDVHIDFIGVWDTVHSVGLFPHTLPFTKANNAIRVFRHALALDERRARFRPALYRYTPSELDAKYADTPVAGDKPKHGSLASFFSRMKQALYGYTPIEDARPDTPSGDAPEQGTTSFLGRLFRFLTGRGSAQMEKQKKQRELERHFSEDHESMHAHALVEGKKKDTDVFEVWFAGCHCDVGGGSVTNDTTDSLARIPLRWMVRECFKTNTGIRFHGELLKEIGMDPSTLYPVVQPRPAAHKSGGGAVKTVLTGGTEEDHDWRDAHAELVDQLVKARYWWLLEIIPMRVKKSIKVNLGRYRHVPTKKRTFYVHRSVETRMKSGYKIQATHKREPVFVD